MTEEQDNQNPQDGIIPQPEDGVSPDSSDASGAPEMPGLVAAMHSQLLHARFQRRWLYTQDLGSAAGASDAP